MYSLMGKILRTVWTATKIALAGFTVGALLAVAWIAHCVEVHNTKVDAFLAGWDAGHTRMQNECVLRGFAQWVVLERFEEHRMADKPGVKFEFYPVYTPPEFTHPKPVRPADDILDLFGPPLDLDEETVPALPEIDDGIPEVPV